jgi:hypothetical protein
MHDQVAKLKEIMKKKLDIVEIPENGKEAVIVIEEQIEKSYTAEVGYGNVWSFPTSFDIVGKIFTETTPEFTENTIKINKKQKHKTRKLMIGVAEPGFIRKIDEATWDGKFHTLEDLIELIDHLY